jgi:hypothetical protein
MSAIEIAARRIIVRWDEWQADADQSSQVAQDSTAGDEVLVGYLMEELTQLVASDRKGATP